MIPRITPIALAALLFVLTGCAASQPMVTSEVHIRHLPPDKTDIIEVLIRSEGVPLTVDRSCSSVSDIKDGTVGRYTSSLISYLKEGETNWVEVTVVPRRAPAGMYWRATVMFHIALDSEDPFNYGVQFLIRQSDGLVVPSSFSCPGA
jgi:hypothetical protein